jgi:hypothetical protein
VRVTRSHLRRIIREALQLEDDKYAQLPPTSHERVTGVQSKFVEDNWLPWLAERGLGAEDLNDLARFTGAPDRSWLPAAPPADGMDGPADLELWARNKKTGIRESLKEGHGGYREYGEDEMVRDSRAGSMGETQPMRVDPKDIQQTVADIANEPVFRNAKAEDIAEAAMDQLGDLSDEAYNIAWRIAKGMGFPA